MNRMIGRALCFITAAVLLILGEPKLSLIFVAALFVILSMDDLPGKGQ